MLLYDIILKSTWTARVSVKAEKYMENSLTFLYSTTPWLFKWSDFLCQAFPKGGKQGEYLVWRKPSSPLLPPERDQPHRSRTGTCPQWQTWPQQVARVWGGLRGTEGVTAGSKPLAGIEAPLSLAFPDVHTHKPATLGETAFAPAHVIPTGWLGWLELPGKDRSVSKSPTSARDRTSRGEPRPPCVKAVVRHLCRRAEDAASSLSRGFGSCIWAGTVSTFALSHRKREAGKLKVDTNACACHVLISENFRRRDPAYPSDTTNAVPPSFHDRDREIRMARKVLRHTIEAAENHTREETWVPKSLWEGFC